MSSRVGFALAALLLLIAAVLRFTNLATLPSGLLDEEVRDIRIVESVRAGRVEVFYNMAFMGENGGREGLYHTILASTSFFTGGGLIGYRILSVLISLITLAIVYAVGMRLFSPLGGLAAMALLAVDMWPVLLAREIGRETFLPLLVAAVLLALTRAFPVYNPPREPGTIPYTALGLLLGLGFYLHPTNFLITLVSMIFIVYMVLSPQRLTRRTLSYTSFAILVLMIVVMPYLISSIRLPELDGAGRVFGTYTIAQRPPLQAIISGLNGLFFVGDDNPARNLPGRPLLDLVSGLFFLVGVLTAVRSWRVPRFGLLVIALVVLLPVALLNVGSPNFNAFAPILPLIALLFGLGVETLYRGLTIRTRGFMRVALVALVLFNIGWTVNDLFIRWPTLPEVQTAYHARAGQLAHHLDLTAESVPTVICTPTLTAAAPSSEISNISLVALMMHRKYAPFRYADCGTGMVFTEGGALQQVILPDEGMLANIHPYLRDWLIEGEIASPATAPAGAVITMDVSQPLADKIGAFTTTALVGFAPESPGGAVDVYPPVTFGGNLAFLGYETEGNIIYPPGSIVTSITYWRVDGVIPADVRLFTHILSDPVNIVSQRDTISVSPPQLQPRDVFVQITFVPLRPSTPSGDYQVSIGAYQDSDKRRLEVLSQGLSQGTRLFLRNHAVKVS